MAEYTRDENLNTPEYWNKSWERLPDGSERLHYVQERVGEIIKGLGSGRVVEYGFGHTKLAEIIGKDRWEGRDFSEVAVRQAREKGFQAYVTRCGDSPGYRKATLVALEVLEHLDRDEMIAFLSTSRNAPHAIFTVPIAVEEGDVQKHMRGWDREADFADFLGQWWPYIETEVVGKGRHRRMLAHCTRKPPERPPLLTVGCSTLMDFWGVNYTLMSLRAQWGHLIEDGTVEVVLVDNHPDPEGDPESEEAVRLMEKVATDCGARYVQWCEKQGTYPGKHQLQVEARGEWVLTMDSHVFLSRGTLETVLDLIRANPKSDDLYHFPVLHKMGVMVDFRHLDAIYYGLERKPVYGFTGEMKTPGAPYPVAAQITSAYLVRREAWFTGKGYDPILGMYGGWEGPLQVKWRLLGRDVLSLRHPTAQSMQLWHWHHFNTRVFKKVFKWAVDGFQHRGAKVRYHTSSTKIRNYAASSAVTGGEEWVRRHCELRGWDFRSAPVQEGLKAGMVLRPWMVENLARPEWEDIAVFFRWMRDEAKVPGALQSW